MTSKKADRKRNLVQLLNTLHSCKPNAQKEHVISTHDMKIIEAHIVSMLADEGVFLIGN